MNEIENELGDSDDSEFFGSTANVKVVYQYNATSTVSGWHKASPLFYSFVSHYHREGLEIMRSENYLGEGIFECLLTKKGPLLEYPPLSNAAELSSTIWG